MKNYQFYYWTIQVEIHLFNRSNEQDSQTRDPIQDRFRIIKS